MYCGFLPIDRHAPCARAIPEGGCSPYDVRRHAVHHLDTRTREQLGETALVKVWSTQSVKFLFEPLRQLRRRVCRRQLANLSKQGMQGDWQDPAEEVPTENSI